MVTSSWQLQDTPEMDEEQFIQWQSLLEERTGMQLSEQRKTFLETSICMRMRELGAVDYNAYYQRLLSGLAGEVEWATLVDRLTVQETSFFRHTSSYELVYNYCLEYLAEQGNEPLNIWSVGCSTGEEPYSLAMMIDTLLRERQLPRYFGITATDISLPALSKGRNGIYKASKLHNIPVDWQQRYFKPLSGDRLQVVEALQERVCFAQVNVRELDKAPMSGMHIIYCQNLLIYFRRKRQREIVSQLIESLSPGGLLVLGVGEVIDFNHPLAERKAFNNTLAYSRKRAKGGNE